MRNDDWGRDRRRENRPERRTCSMSFFSFFLTYFFLATDYDNDNEDMDGATTDVERRRRGTMRKTGLRDGRRLLGPYSMFFSSIVYLLFFYSYRLR